jgi:hypothetical protein
VIEFCDVPLVVSDRKPLAVMGLLAFGRFAENLGLDGLLRSPGIVLGGCGVGFIQLVTIRDEDATGVQESRGYHVCNRYPAQHLI